jgi:tetratricopeptide (TPR) repeat protein
MRSNSPKPANDEDFELLCLSLLRNAWGNLSLQRHGRRGQRQYGVDLIGRQGERVIGIQCKLRTNDLTFGEIVSEVEKAREFRPVLSHYVLATTSRRDSHLQREVLDLSISHERSNLFSVELLSWDDLDELLYLHPNARALLDGSGSMVFSQLNQLERKLDGRLDRLQAVADHLWERYESHTPLFKGESAGSSIEIEALRSQLRDALQRIEQLSSEHPSKSRDALEMVRQQGDATKVLEFLLQEREKSAHEYSSLSEEIAAVARVQGKTDVEVATLRDLLRLRPDDVASWNRLGRALTENGDLPGGLEAFGKVEELGVRGGDVDLIVMAYLNKGAAYRAHSELEAALSILHKALTLLAPDPPDADYVQCLTQIGIVHQLRGELLDARDYYLRAIQSSKDLVEAPVGAMTALANLVYEHGQLEKARDLYRILRKIERSKSERALIAGNLAGVYAALGRPAKAEALTQYALRIDRTNSNLAGIARHLQGLANLRYQEKNFVEAERLLKEASDICHRTGDRVTLTVIYGTLTEVLLADAVYNTRDFDTALKVAEEAVGLAKTQGSKSGMARYQISLGRVLVMKGRLEEAAPLFEAAAVTFSDLRIPHMENLAREMLRDCHRISDAVHKARTESQADLK